MAFRTCSFCGQSWETLTEFVDDAGVKPLGLVVDFRDPYRTLVLFNHRCQTTIAVAVDELRTLLPPLDGESLAGQPPCPGRCQKLHDLEACDQACRNAPLRRLVAAMVSAKGR